MTRPNPNEWPGTIDLEISILELLLEKRMFLPVEFIADKCTRGNVAAIVKPLLDMFDAGLVHVAGGNLSPDHYRAGTRVSPVDAPAESRLLALKGKADQANDTDTDEGEPMNAQPNPSKLPRLGTKMRALFDYVEANPGRTANHAAGDVVGLTGSSASANLTQLKKRGLVRKTGERPATWFVVGLPTPTPNPDELLEVVEFPELEQPRGPFKPPLVSVERADPTAPIPPIVLEERPTPTPPADVVVTVPDGVVDLDEDPAWSAADLFPTPTETETETETDMLRVELELHMNYTGETQSRIADAAGVTQPVVSRLLAGVTDKLQRATAKRLRAYLTEASEARNVVALQPDGAPPTEEDKHRAEAVDDQLASFYKTRAHMHIELVKVDAIIAALEAL